jgi:hypothetical protein
MKKSIKKVISLAFVSIFSFSTFAENEKPKLTPSTQEAQLTGIKPLNLMHEISAMPENLEMVNTNFKNYQINYPGCLSDAWDWGVAFAQVAAFSNSNTSQTELEYAGMNYYYATYCSGGTVYFIGQ